MTDGPRERIAAAFRATAHDCPGDCGQSERECMDAHPIQVEVLHFDQVAVIGGPVEALADVALAAVAPELERAEKAEQQVARIRAFLEDMSTWCSPHGVAAVYAQRGLDALDGVDPLGVAAPATQASGPARSAWLDVAKETLLAAEAKAKAETPTARELAESFAFATAALMPRAEPVFCHHPNKHVSWVTRSQAGWGTGRVFTATCPDCPARAEAAEVEPVLQPWLLNVNRCSEACAERHTVRPGCLLAPDFSKPILRADRPVPPSCGHEH